MVTFRVHTSTAGTIDVQAETPKQAGEAVKKTHPDQIITKIKLVREK